jgi:hypothetical protein
MGKGARVGRPDEHLIRWLLDSAGPVVRYRAARELMDGGSADIAGLQKELLACPLVRLWMDRLKEVRKIHDSGNDRFENVVGKLLEFGLGAECEEFATLLRPFISRLNRGPEHKQGMMFMLGATIVAWGLARAGIKDPSLDAFMQQRLGDLSEMARKGSYDIYVKGIAFPDMPADYRDRYAVVKEEFTPSGEFRLPNIHDIYMLSAIQDSGPAADVAAKIEQVVSYVLHPDYQALDPAFGYVRQQHDGKAHYYVLGWAASLPGYSSPLKKGRPAVLLQRVELMCHFPVACRHQWTLRCLEYLDQYKTGAGTWSFPREYITEKPVGYWVSGAHMGLEEDRRSKQSIELESTFRMLRIKKLFRTNAIRLHKI